VSEVYIDEFDLTPSEEELKAREEQQKIKKQELEAEKELNPVIEVPGLGLPPKELVPIHCKVLLLTAVFPDTLAVAICEPFTYNVVASEPCFHTI